MAGVHNIPKKTRQVLGIGYKHPKKRRGQKHYEIQHMPNAEFKANKPAPTEVPNKVKVIPVQYTGKGGVQVYELEEVPVLVYRKPGSVSVNRRGSGGRDELRALKRRLKAKKAKRLARRAAG